MCLRWLGFLLMVLVVCLFGGFVWLVCAVGGWFLYGCLVDFVLIVCLLGCCLLVICLFGDGLVLFVDWWLCCGVLFGRCVCWWWVCVDVASFGWCCVFVSGFWLMMCLIWCGGCLISCLRLLDLWVLLVFAVWLLFGCVVWLLFVVCWFDCFVLFVW